MGKYFVKPVGTLLLPERDTPTNLHEFSSYYARNGPLHTRSNVVNQKIDEIPDNAT